MAQLFGGRRAVLVALAGPLCGLLSGCTLIDQRFFDADAGKPPVRPLPPTPPPPLAPPLEGPPPLLSIRLPVPPDARDSIRRAVAAARARKATVVFDVVEITPGTQAGPEAADVAQTIVSASIPAARVNLSARPLAGVAHEIRIFVR